MTPAQLAQRIAALDWSGVSLSHLLAVTAACETLKRMDDAIRNRHEATQREMVVPLRARHPGSDSRGVDLADDRNAEARTGRSPADAIDQGREREAHCDREIHAMTATVLRFPILPASAVRDCHYTPARRVALTLLDGTPFADALCQRAPGAAWDWIVATVTEELRCYPEQVGCEDDTVTVDGMPCYLIDR